jgi:hypothetical protein
MTAKDALRLAALIRLKTLCASLSALLTPIDGYLTLKSSLDNIIEKIKKSRAISKANIKDKAKLKKQVRLAMEDTILHYLHIAQVKALNVSNQELITALNFTKSYLKRAKDDVVNVRAEEIKKIIAFNLTILSNILPSDITLMELAIKSYVDLAASPKAAINYRKTKGTDSIPLLLNQAEIPRDYIGKIFESNLPEYFSQYKTAIKVGNIIGVRHISAIISFLDAETGTPMHKVKTTFNRGGKEYTKLSTVRGFARFMSLPEGNYTLAAECKGYTPLLKNNIAISNNKIVRINCKLHKIILTNSLTIKVCDKETSIPLKDVSLLIPAIAISILTDENGIANKTNLPTTTLQALLTLPGYSDIDFTIIIGATQSINLEFLMEKLH